MANINELISQQPNPNDLGRAPMGMPTAQPGPAPMGPTPDGAPLEAPMGQEAPAAAPDAGALATPEQMQELKQLLATVQSANSKLVSQKLVDRNEINVAKEQLMKQLFGLMQEAGVDPGNPASVKAFLQQLEQSNPDLLEMFETAFRGFTAGQPGAQAPMPEGEEGMMAEPTEDTAVQERFQNLNRLGEGM